MTIRRRTEQWIRLLRHLGGDPPEVGVRLGAGECDPPLIASIASTGPGRGNGAAPATTSDGFNGRPQPAVPGAITSVAASVRAIAPEVALWRAVMDPRPTPESLPPGCLDGQRRGPLLAVDEYRAIEVWTECELCALHALRNLAGRDDLEPGLRTALRARLAGAMTWHIEHTQPDNATSRPWAIHAFAERDEPETQLYAEGLLHACQIGAARPEPLSRAILLDAACQLERALLGSETPFR